MLPPDRLQLLTYKVNYCCYGCFYCAMISIYYTNIYYINICHFLDVPFVSKLAWNRPSPSTVSICTQISLPRWRNTSTSSPQSIERNASLSLRRWYRSNSLIVLNIVIQIQFRAHHAWQRVSNFQNDILGSNDITFDCLQHKYWHIVSITPMWIFDILQIYFQIISLIGRQFVNFTQIRQWLIRWFSRLYFGSQAWYFQDILITYSIHDFFIFMNLNDTNIQYIYIFI